MLNREQLKEYRLRRGLSTRDVAFYCDISQPLIVKIENGTYNLNRHNHDEYVKGVNDAYAAKKTKTFVKPPRVNQPKDTGKAKNYIPKEKTKPKKIKFDAAHIKEVAAQARLRMEKEKENKK